MLYSKWNYLFKELADPGTEKWLIMKNPLPILTIISLYLLFVLKIGPKYMQNRAPFKIKPLIMIYNLVQVICNINLFIRTLSIVKDYNPICQPINQDYQSEAAALVLEGYFLYFLNKLFDLFDTIFFVLRKKYTHVSFLHLYHHVFMVIITWIFTKYAPGGQSVSIGLCNSFVHVILYGYYFLSLFGPKVQKYLWWKKYITSMQLVQFLIIFIHNTIPLFVDCGYPKWTLVITLSNAIYFTHLFTEFYKRNYITPKKKHNKNKN